MSVDSVLTEIVRRHGTPTYAFDIRRLREQAAKLREALPEVEVLYSLKANASLGICDVLADCGLGADAASAGELATAIAAGFPADRVFVAGPFKSAETVETLRDVPAAVVSVDSLSELKWLSEQQLANSVVLRLRPDFGSCAVVKAGSESRFGFTEEQLDQAARWLDNCSLDVIGFHVFAGSQVLDAEQLNEHLERSLALSLRAAEQLGIAPTYLNLGGGFGIAYAADQSELDLDTVAATLNRLVDRARPARIVLELGRYLVAPAGYYLTGVVGRQTFQDRPAVVVDGGVHQRADMCGCQLRRRQFAPRVVRRAAKWPSGLTTAKTADDQPIDSVQLDAASLAATDVLGSLSLPDDVLLEACPLPADLAAGDALAFVNTGAYGLWSSPALFHGSPLPAEVAFDDEQIYLMRQRKPAASLLDDQLHVPCKTAAPHA